jgi:hypothetical protein
MSATRLAIAAVALTCVTASMIEPSRGPELALSRASGAISTSRPATAIVTARDLRPGDSATGTVRVSNRGEGDAQLRLSSSPAVDRPGTAGGHLSNRLVMTVEELPQRTRIASGNLRAIAGCHGLGRLRAGAARTFRFTVRFERSASDNAYAGASASVDERWTAGAAGGCGMQKVKNEHRSSGAPGTPTHADPSLPFTGLAVALLAVVGAALAAAGRALRRRIRPRP